jgi:hypothetical protein
VESEGLSAEALKADSAETYAMNLKLGAASDTLEVHTRGWCLYHMLEISAREKTVCIMKLGADILGICTRQMVPISYIGN